MASEYYEPGPQRAAKVNDLFGTIAPRYDLINDLQSFWLHRLWKRRLVRLARAGAGQRALDVCCGTGDVAFALAQSGAEVVGIDFSEAMLEVARKRGKGRRPKAGQGVGCGSGEEAENTAKNPHFMAGDSMDLPFPDSSFDVVTVAYGLRNLSDWERGLHEMWRVARVGGRLLVLDFGKPENSAWRTLYFAYLRWMVPLFGKLFCGNSALYGYILESLQHYPAQQGVAAAMRELGCAEVRIIRLLGGIMTINYGSKTGANRGPSANGVSDGGRPPAGGRA
jgi:demethylmenaquinone methyltransferase / 2-methoxy-6-polyprenyl-1,4-benzoquinol methylase